MAGDARNRTTGLTERSGWTLVVVECQSRTEYLLAQSYERH